MALPCSTKCDHYFEGCHKSCTYWAAHRIEIHRENEKMKQYLKECNETTSIILRQMLSISAPRRQS